MSTNSSLPKKRKHHRNSKNKQSNTNHSRHPESKNNHQFKKNKINDTSQSNNKVTSKTNFPKTKITTKNKNKPKINFTKISSIFTALLMLIPIIVFSVLLINKNIAIKKITTAIESITILQKDITYLEGKYETISITSNENEKFTKQNQEITNTISQYKASIDDLETKIGKMEK